LSDVNRKAVRPSSCSDRSARTIDAMPRSTARSDARRHRYFCASDRISGRVSRGWARTYAGLSLTSPSLNDGDIGNGFFSNSRRSRGSGVAEPAHRCTQLDAEPCGANWSIAMNNGCRSGT
jgi:hypothetical protein